jgi:mannan endo-1,4-beta-mannosidase
MPPVIDPEIYKVSPQLINPNADDNAKRLMQYLTDIYGKKILTGQSAQKGVSSAEVRSIQSVTGKYPAVLGFDMMDYSLSRAARGATSDAVEKAIEFDKMGGIVTFCWHWNAPTKYITGIWWRAFYTDAAANINLADIMNGSDQEGYELLIADIDAIAVQLKRLQDAGVPVLWRPLHEASGGWFWWGAAGPEACKKLWILLYDKLTGHHRLNNLIWLWNGQSADWYPGDQYVDMIGEDIYAGKRVYNSQIGKFLKAASYPEKEHKMIVLSENGTIFDFDLAIRDGAMWGFFVVWNGEFVLKNDDIVGYSESYTERHILIKAYNHAISVTLDDLPDLKNYPLR